MHKLLRLFRLRAQLRYWRRRAWLAEARLEAEFNRNRQREDSFVSAAIMGSRGMWGVAPRTGPALQPKQAIETKAIHPQLTGADQMEFDMYWLPDAKRANVSEAQALNEFMQELAKRRTPLNDDPYGAN